MLPQHGHHGQQVLEHHSTTESPQLAYQREYFKLLLARGFDDDLAKAVGFIIKNLQPATVTQSQWGEMVKLFTNQPPYTVQAVNRESIMFKLDYLEKKTQESFSTFQESFRKVRWEITNREELEPLIELLTVGQIRNLAMVAPEWYKILAQNQVEQKDQKLHQWFPHENEVRANVQKRGWSADPTSKWFTTVPKHQWDWKEQMLAC